ncbi:MAG: arginine deiminase family protein [Bacillota bacterium]
MSMKDTPLYYHAVLERIPPRSTPAFEDEGMQERVWGRRWGVYNDVGRLRVVLLHRPGRELEVMTEDKYDPTIEALIDDREQWYFRSDRAPDISSMQREHDGLASALRDHGVVVEYVDCSPRNPNAMFTRDTAIAVKGGIVIGRLGPVGADYGTGRRGEEAYVARKIAQLGMPILRAIHGEGLMEGGSFCFLDEHHAAVGTGFRQNPAGVDQLRNVLKHQDVELIEVPLVGHSLHIDGAIVMIDYHAALVNVTRLPYWFLNTLADLGIEPINVDSRDPATALNCIALAPGKLLMTETARWTADNLDRMGFECIQIPYDECHKHGGSIHCSTLPLVRDR